ncbi:hypothetical protein ICN84_07840 [Akkermansia glycaniphila]|uniref:portal protein n=1 Tax=Akkermansia glycaniphila TaxID=1679444 RepID=UPI001C038F98|nr:portal protein [Akkermansia glycaniphila]MBT9449984.1 hypothetical protein [Akkermansia glycaniphila]
MNAQDYIRTAESLLSDMATRTGEWDWLRNHIMPGSNANARQEENPSSSQRRRYSTEANQALKILASAHLTYITPMGQRWFALKSSDPKPGKDAEGWFANATEAMLAELAKSNFYTVAHQCMLDRCLTGTGCMYCEWLPSGRLGFTHIPTGTYGGADGKDGMPEVFCRTFKLSAYQAAQEFGLENLPAKIREAHDKPEKMYSEKHQYVHLVMPRDSCNFGHKMIDARHQKYASLYIAWEGEKQIVKEDGYYEFPYLVTRFLRWGESFFGFAPGTDVREEIAAVLKLERIMDVLGETAAFPRILTLAEQVGEVDMRAGGRTVIKPQAAQLQLPREWAASGRYDVGKDRIEEKENKIREAYFVPMLQVISSVDREMTATEVNAREAEKVLAFSPSFTLFISDMSPFMLRIFCELLRAGKIPDMENAPDELIKLDEAGNKNNDRQTGRYEIALPAVSYLGKISQAIERVQRYGVEAVMQTIAQFIQTSGDATVLDCLKIPEIVRFMYESSGAPMKGLRTEKEIEEIQKQRQQAEQAAQQAQLMQDMAQANRDNAAAQKP